MNYCIVEIFTQTASFRNPDFQNFHKTLFLPPPSTVIGLMGAALGLSPKMSQEYFEKNNIKLGIYGKSLGLAKDLWKYKNLKGERSVIKKEFLFYNSYYIAFFSSCIQVIEELKNAFENPTYALTLGNSDSLAFIKDVFIKKKLEELKEFDEIEYCVLSGDILEEVMRNIGNGEKISIYNSSESLVYDLPIKFNYKSDYGMRNIVKRKQFSFVGRKMKLNIKKKGIVYKDIFIPILDIL